MNTKMKRGIFWGVVVASTVLVINILHFLLGGGAFGRGWQGDGPRGMERPGGFGHHQMMNGPHHEGGFPWLFLLIGLALLVLLVRWGRRKKKGSSVQQLIDTSLVNSDLPVTNQNATVLDQWEKNLVIKKEND